jgi:SpoVK/Ycf46/Vps4 family AAA+-type ATPase
MEGKGPEKVLKKLFKLARERRPSFLVFDNIHLLKENRY